MAIVTAYRCGSGMSYEDACFLGDRYDEDVGLARDRSECWVLAVRRSPDPKSGGEFNLRYQRGTPTVYTGLWRSPNGAVWVSDADGAVHYNKDPWADDAGAQWTTHDNFFHMRANGVWGLDDDHVFVWLDGDTLQQVKTAQPRQLDARDGLVLTTATVIGGSADGEAFRAVGKDFLANARGSAGLLENWETDDRTKVAHALDEVCDRMYGYTIDHVNLEAMDDGDFDPLVAECCAKLGIAEPADLSAVPRDPRPFVDHFHRLWDGKTIN